MKLQSFNIQNYRSIIHSGWCKLAHDHITALIGQNESGKTSVLGALNSFYIKEIHEDVLRSDQSLPIVSCKFELEKEKLSDFLNLKLLPEDLHSYVNKAKDFILTRAWKADRSSSLFIGDDEILNYFEKKQVEKATIEEKTQNEIEVLLSQAEKIFNEMEDAEKYKDESKEQLTRTRKNLDRAKKKAKRARKPDETLVAEKELELSEKDYQKAEIEYTSAVEAFELKKHNTQELSEKVSVCKACAEAIRKVEDLKSRRTDYNSQIKELDHQLDITTGEKDQKSAYTRIQKLMVISPFRFSIFCFSIR